MFKTLSNTKTLFTQSWKLSNEVIERMELVKKAIENLRQDILKEIPEVIDYADDIRNLQLNIMEIHSVIDMLKTNFESISSDVQELLDAPDIVIPEPLKPEIKYYTKTVYSHNRWVVSLVSISVIASISALILQMCN